jgi:hypothetical protein
MNSRRDVAQSAGWGTVLAVALLGIALAALVVLMPWHVSDLPGGSKSSSSSRGTVVEVRAPGLTIAEPAADNRSSGPSVDPR